MADYRRFISYMYLYENGRKTVNSGFVRVESRNGQCRMHLHMNGIYGPEDEAYGVYMLIRETDGYIGITAGSLRMRQQAGELDLTTDSDHLMGTAYSLDRVSGMVVLGHGGDGSRLYGTRWDDEPLETERFVSRETLSEGLILFMAGRRYGEPEQENREDRAEEPEQEDREDRSEEPEQEDRENRAEEPEAAPVPGRMAANWLMEAAPDASPSMDVVRREAAMTAAADPVAAPDAGEMSLSSGTADGTKTAEDTSSVDEEPISDALSEAEIREQQMQVNAYERLLHQFPQMYPFDDNSMEICVRLELQDIGVLPMQCWLYGSNSFLLHGYYCYRHLILAKGQVDAGSGDHQETAYILGVPGVWQHREQYMASMFGFRHFKPVSREHTGSGAFGYWFVKLQ